MAVAVLFLVWARSQRKGFHLPGGDGVAITLAGGWAVLLLVWRLFDKPDIQGAGATMGIQWGIFGALLAAGALIVAGARVRAAHRPEPPNPAADDVGWVAAPPAERERGPDRRPREASAVTDVLRERPAWEGDAREPPVDRSRERTTRLRRRRSLPRAHDTPRRRRPLARGDHAAAVRSVGGSHPAPAAPGGHGAAVGGRTSRALALTSPQGSFRLPLQLFPRLADETGR